MEQEKILMEQRELRRWHLMKLVKAGKITLKEAGEPRVGSIPTSGTILLTELS
jgi:hypothetical protein